MNNNQIFLDKKDTENVTKLLNELCIKYKIDTEKQELQDNFIINDNLGDIYNDIEYFLNYLKK